MIWKLYYISNWIDGNFPQFADNEDLQLEWRTAKRSNKIKVASFIKERTGYSVSADAMFDIQVIFFCFTISFISVFVSMMQ